LIECIHKTNHPGREFVLGKSNKLRRGFAKAVFPDIGDISVAKFLGQVLTIHLKDERRVLK
jgi:hypothetical protein